MIILLDIKLNLSYYASIMLDAFRDLLCSKSCRHNRPRPTNDPFLCVYCALHKQSQEIDELKRLISLLTSPNSISGNKKLTQVPSSKTSTTLDRKFNLVFYGIEENPPNTVRSERLKAELSRILGVINNIVSKIDANFIKDYHCLRKYNPNRSKPRPILVKFLRSADVTSILFEKSNLALPFSIKTDMTAEEKKIEGLLLKERWELLQKDINRNQIKIRQNSLYINDRLHAGVLDAKLHTLSSTKHRFATTDTLQSASHGQSDAQQMDTNQPNLEHQQSDMVEPISKKIMTEHQESVTNEPTLDNQSNQQNESVSALQSSLRQSHTFTTTEKTSKPMESS